MIWSRINFKCHTTVNNPLQVCCVYLLWIILIDLIQLMKHELDEEPILLELQMMITSIKWSPDGEVLGVVGSDASTNAKASSCIVQLFSHNGMHLRTLRVPGTKVRYNLKIPSACCAAPFCSYTVLVHPEPFFKSHYCLLSCSFLLWQCFILGRRWVEAFTGGGLLYLLSKHSTRIQVGFLRDQHMHV